jgi:hypothetical protein
MMSVDRTSLLLTVTSVPKNLATRLGICAEMRENPASKGTEHANGKCSENIHARICISLADCLVPIADIRGVESDRSKPRTLDIGSVVWRRPYLPFPHLVAQDFDVIDRLVAECLAHFPPDL